MTKKQNMEHLTNIMEICEKNNIKTISYAEYIGRLICSLYDDVYDRDDKNEIKYHIGQMFNKLKCNDFNSILIEYDADNDMYTLVNVENKNMCNIQMGVFDCMDINIPYMRDVIREYIYNI